MKKIAIYLILLFTYFTNCATAQIRDTLKTKYTNETITRYGSAFLKGSERLDFKQLSHEFNMSNLGLASYQKAKQYRTTSKILSFASLFAFASATAVLANGGNNDLGLGLIIGQLALTMGGRKFSEMSNQNLDRAIWQRNKDLLFPSSQ
jgi:hypothetical protein